MNEDTGALASTLVRGLVDVVGVMNDNDPFLWTKTREAAAKVEHQESALALIRGMKADYWKASRTCNVSESNCSVWVEAQRGEMTITLSIEVDWYARTGLNKRTVKVAPRVTVSWIPTGYSGYPGVTTQRCTFAKDTPPGKAARAIITRCVSRAMPSAAFVKKMRDGDNKFRNDRKSIGEQVTELTGLRVIEPDESRRIHDPYISVPDGTWKGCHGTTVEIGAKDVRLDHLSVSVAQFAKIHQIMSETE